MPIPTITRNAKNTGFTGGRSLAGTAVSAASTISACSDCAMKSFSAEVNESDERLLR